ncbi:MAG: DMT family transporter [Merdibacter sp.]
MLVLVTVIWGGGFIATSAALETLSPFYILMIRFVGSALLSFVVAAKAIKEIKASTLCARTSPWHLLLFLAFAFQTFGLQGNTASTNAFPTSTNVIFVPYISWAIFRRRPTMRQILASLLCVIGISLLTLKGDAFSFGKGEFYSLMCAVFFAAHIIALDWGTKRRERAGDQRLADADRGDPHGLRAVL